jgi:flagellin
MALSVATNIGAMAAMNAASSVNRSMETSMERLSTGLRINSASDDAAGIAIASRLEADFRGMNQAMRNAADAQSFIDTAEGAYKEVENLLQRIRELAVQGSNSTLGSTDLGYIEDEMTALEAEITAIASNTSWSDQQMLNAATTLTIQTGADAAQQFDVVTTALALATLSLGAATSMSTPAVAEFEAYITTVDTAIETVNGYRAALGAVSNRLDSTIANLSNNSANIAESLGRIQDADFAAETTSLAKNQILQQAATSMLAQANASKQSVLSLLQG